MQNLQLFSGYEMTKTQIKVVSETIIQDLLNNGNIINAIDSLAKMEFLIKELKSSKELIDYAREEIAKFGKSVTTESGTKIELAETGTKYDYSVCNDDVVVDLYSEKAFIESKIKEREAFLKTISPSGIDVVNENGELVKLYPPSKSSTSSLKTTISK